MKLDISSEVAMKRCGEQLGRRLKGGEVIELVGDVGAGKTTFTKGLARGMGVSEDVQSPSFTISRLYDARNNLRLAHYDFYRLQDAGIMAHDLEESTSDFEMVTVIEWADVAKNVLPEEYLEIRFSSPTETSRQINLEAHGESYSHLTEQLYDFAA